MISPQKEHGCTNNQYQLGYGCRTSSQFSSFYFFHLLFFRQRFYRLGQTLQSISVVYFIPYLFIYFFSSRLACQTQILPFCSVFYFTFFLFFYFCFMCPFTQATWDSSGRRLLHRESENEKYFLFHLSVSAGSLYYLQNREK